MRLRQLIAPAVAVGAAAGAFVLRVVLRDGTDSDGLVAPAQTVVSRSVAADLAEPAPAIAEVQTLFDQLKATLVDADARATTRCPNAARQVRADDAGKAIIQRDEGAIPATIQFVQHYRDTAKLQPLGYSAIGAMGLGSQDPAQPHVTVAFDISAPAALDCLNTHVVTPLNDGSQYPYSTICRVHYDQVNQDPPFVSFVVGCGPKDFENPTIGNHDPKHYWHIPQGDEAI
jgi:hypothetical protein